MIEIWKEILPYYEVSNFGNVRTKSRRVKTYYGFRQTVPRSVPITDNGHGYKLFGTQIDHKRKNFYIHRAVAELFIPNPSNLPEVNHKDGNKANNHISNLEWVTLQQNRAHAVVSGFIKNGESSPSAKLKESDVVEILDLFLKNPGANKTHCARKYGIKDTTVHKILNGHRWVRTYKKWLTTKTPEE